LPHQDDTAIPPVACTSACTSEAKSHSSGSLDALAAALLSLSPEDRARLAALLLGQHPTQAKAGASPD
jgi:hypothetical protein